MNRSGGRHVDGAQRVEAKARVASLDDADRVFYWPALRENVMKIVPVIKSSDERYETFRSRGLNTTPRRESPIHTALVDQTWGLREFAVTDPDGNNLCFCMPKR